MRYEFTISFYNIQKAEQADEYTEKILEFLDKEIGEDWIAFGRIVEDDSE